MVVANYNFFNFYKMAILVVPSAWVNYLINTCLIGEWLCQRSANILQIINVLLVPNKLEIKSYMLQRKRIVYRGNFTKLKGKSRPKLFTWFMDWMQFECNEEATYTCYYGIIPIKVLFIWTQICPLEKPHTA